MWAKAPLCAPFLLGHQRCDLFVLFVLFVVVLFIAMLLQWIKLSNSLSVECTTGLTANSSAPYVSSHFAHLFFISFLLSTSVLKGKWLPVHHPRRDSGTHSGGGPGQALPSHGHARYRVVVFAMCFMIVVVYVVMWFSVLLLFCHLWWFLFLGVFHCLCSWTLNPHPSFYPHCLFVLSVHLTKQDCWTEQKRIEMKWKN